MCYFLCLNSQQATPLRIQAFFQKRNQYKEKLVALVVPGDRSEKCILKFCWKGREAKNKKVKSFEAASVYWGLSHWSQVPGLASFDTMIRITRNTKFCLNEILVALCSNIYHSCIWIVTSTGGKTWLLYVRGEPFLLSSTAWYKEWENWNVPHFQPA